jgi:hypothetical protein
MIEESICHNCWGDNEKKVLVSFDLELDDNINISNCEVCKALQAFLKNKIASH